MDKGRYTFEPIVDKVIEKKSRGYKGSSIMTLFAITHLLLNEKIRLHLIARRLGINERTVRRHVVLLNKLGIKVQSDAHKHYISGCPICHSPISQQILALENERIAWSLLTFTEATAISCLRKLETEISEIERNIDAGVKDAEEYADAMMCLLDSAARIGISFEEIITAYARKIEINKRRRRKKNFDNTYSHVKEVSHV